MGNHSIKDTFRGNVNLKAPNVTEMLTPEEFRKRALEFSKCANDILYFANNYFTIISPGKGKHVIETYSKQNGLLNFLIENDRAVILASRQVGKTTAYCIFCLWYCCFNEDKRVIILANKESTAFEIVSKIKLAYELLPSYLKPGISGRWNEGSVEFSNGCKIEGLATSSDAARSKSANVLIFDEFAFVPENIAKKLWSSVYPIVSSAIGTKVIIVSTPNGATGMFYEFYQKAQFASQDNEGLTWKSYRIDWFDVPDRDEKWMKLQIQSLGGQKEFDQEFGCDFHGSSLTLVDPMAISGFKEKLLKDIPKFHSEALSEDGEMGNYKIKYWLPIEKDKIYVIGADVADGVGGNKSVAYVFDITNPLNIKQVAGFADDKISTPDFAYLLSKLGTIAGNCPIMIEYNNMGSTVIKYLTEIYQYDNIPSIGNVDYGIMSDYNFKVDACLFFRTISKSKKIKFELKDMELISEMASFQKHIGNSSKVTYRAANGKADDRMLASIWGMYILHRSVIENYFDCDMISVDNELYPSCLRKTYAANESSETLQYRLKQIDAIRNRLNNIKKMGSDGEEELVEVNHDNDDGYVRSGGFFF